MRANWIRRLSTALAVAVVLLAVSGALADPLMIVGPDPMIVVGPGGAAESYELREDTPGQWIEILVSNGGQVAGCNFNAQIDDGGPASGGTLGPIITSVDLEGSLANPTIFFDNNMPQNDLGSVPQLAMYSILADSGTVLADGVLARLEIDTSGFFGDQTWTLARKPGAAVTRRPGDYSEEKDIGRAAYVQAESSRKYLNSGRIVVIYRK